MRLLLRLGDRGDTRCYRDCLLGGALLRLRRIPGAYAGGDGLVPGGRDGGLLAGATRLGSGRTPSGPLVGPARAPRADDDRIDGGGRPPSRLGLRRGSPDILPRLGRHRPRDGGDLVRTRLRGSGEVVRARTCPGVASGDLSRRPGEHDLSPFVRLAGRCAGLARGALRPGRDPCAPHDLAPRARLAPQSRGPRPPSRRPPDHTPAPTRNSKRATQT